MSKADEAPRVALSRKQSQVWHLLNGAEYPSRIFAGGAAGGGKSWLGCLWQIDRRMRYPRSTGFIGRETFRALQDSTLKTYFGVLEGMGLKSGRNYRYHAQSGDLVYDNGSIQHFRWMQYQPSDPDYNRFGSTEYTDAFVDEAPEVDRRAVDVLFSRIRHMHGKYGIHPKLLLTGNPGQHWIKGEYVMDDNGSFITLPKERARVLFTVDDNPDAEFARRYRRTLEQMDDYDRARLLHGDWEARKIADRPFAFAFTDGHVRVAERRPEDAVYFGLDFNVEPFAGVASHIWEDGRGHHFHTFAEAKLGTSSITDMAAWMRQQCPYLHLMRITGDRGGYSRSIGRDGPVKLFNELRRELGLSEKQFAVPANPRHITSREDVNYVLSNHPDVVVDHRCKHLIADMRYVEVDANGQILKSNRRNEAERSDYLDGWRYTINTYLRGWIDKQRRHG